LRNIAIHINIVVYFKMKSTLSREENVVKLLLILAHADENYHNNEKKIILDLVRQENINVKSYNKILKEVKNLKHSYKKECLKVLKSIKEKNLREKTLTLLANLTSADFILHEDEMLMLQLIADEWGMYKQKLIN